MVLITDDREDGGGVRRAQQLQKKKAPAGGGSVHPVPPAQEQPPTPPDKDHHSCLSAYEDEDEEEDGDDEEEEDEFEEVDFEDLYDVRSVVSDDSFYPPPDADGHPGDADRPPSRSPDPLTLYQACCGNNAAAVRLLVRQGVDEEEVKRTDRNNRTGLLVACYQGYVDVVIALAQCPYLDVNWPDTEGNTALITAAQAGHIQITSYLINYYAGLDLERRNCHGFTALMKAAMQGRQECVRALMMAGADLSSRDHGRHLTPREWAVFTGRYETAWLMARLVSRPCPRQLCDAYSLEWPQLAALVSKAREPRGCLKRLSDAVRNAFNITNVTDPEDQGVIDHLVTVTTAMRSPFIALACRTVCPESPPCVGKRHHAVPEILRGQHRAKELCGVNPERLDTDRRLFQNSRVTLVAKGSAECGAASLQPLQGRRSSLSLSLTASGGGGGGGGDNRVELRRPSLLPLHLMLRRGSVRPSYTIPKVRVSKAPAPTYEPEKIRRRSSGRGGGTEGRGLLQIPKWRYKELKEERRRAEEAERRKLEAAVTRRHLAAGKKEINRERK